MKKKIIWLIFISIILLMAGCWGSDDGNSSAKNDDGYNDQYDYTYGTLDFPNPSNFGVVALSNTGSICILDGNSLTLSRPLLTGQFGSFGGGLFDVAISPDGKTTMVSNFGDSKVFFIDTSDPSFPSVTGSAEIGFFAEDMAVTPNGRFLLVTNGGFASQIAVLDLESQKLITNDVPEDALYHNAVSVTPDGRTVITADYFAGRVHVFTLNKGGNLSYRKSLDLLEDGVRPVNLEIAPDGKTAIVASANAPLVFPVLTITGPGEVQLSQIVKQNKGLGGAQSVAFNQAGNRAYLHCTKPMPLSGEYNGNTIVELKKTSLGWEMSKMIDVEMYGTSQLFGVDTMAMNYNNGYLYVSNPTLSGAKPYVLVLDVNQGSVIKKLDTKPENDDNNPLTDKEDSLPTGIAFWNP